MKGVGIHMSLQRPAPKFGSPEVSHIGVNPLIRTVRPCPDFFLLSEWSKEDTQVLSLSPSEPWSEGDKAPLSQLFLRKQPQDFFHSPAQCRL